MNKKMLPAIIAGCALFFLVLFGSMALIPVERILGVYLVTQIILWLILFFLLLTLCEAKKAEIKIRLYTHAVFCMASICAILLLVAKKDIETGVAAATVLGTYFFLYYVLSAVLLPLNIYNKARMGYRVFCLPFYPFLSKKIKERMLLGNKAAHFKEKFIFAFENIHGAVVKPFLFINKNKHNEIELSDSYYEIELSNDFSEPLFEAFIKTVLKVYCYALGYRTVYSEEGVVTKLYVLTPKGAKFYAKARSAFDMFFLKQSMRAEFTSNTYEGLYVGVICDILGVYALGGPVTAGRLTTNRPWNAYAAYINIALDCYLTENTLKRNYGVAQEIFLVYFNLTTPYSELEALAKRLTQKGFFCHHIVHSDDEYHAKREKERENGNGLLENENVWSLDHDKEMNCVCVRRPCNYNSGLDVVRVRLRVAMNTFKKACDIQNQLQKSKKSSPRREKIMRDQFRKLIGETDVILQSIPSQNQDDLMFESDSKYSLSDLKEAGIFWKSGKGWLVTNPTPKIERIFNILRGTEEDGKHAPARIPKFKEADMQEALAMAKELFDLVKETSAISVGWMINP